MDRVRFLARPRWQGGWHETVSGGVGGGGARGVGGGHAQGLASFAEGGTFARRMASSRRASSRSAAATRPRGARGGRCACWRTRRWSSAYIDGVSHETVRRVLKKNSIKPWRRVGWVIPPQRNADFAAGMERVLDIYRRPYDADFPVVCMDETPRQLIGETRTPVPAAPGRPAREDYEYRRLGSLRVRLHSQARQLAERRRGRTQRLDPPVPQSPHRRPARRGRRLAGGQRPDPSQGRLAVHHGRRPRQAQAPLSDV